MSPNSKLLSALLAVWTAPFLPAATANAQPGHHHSGGHASADHHRGGGEPHRQSTDHYRVGSREDHPRVGSRESLATNHHRPAASEHHHHHSDSQYCPDNFYAPRAPSFQPMYRPISISNYHRIYDPRRYDDDRDARQAFGFNPGLGMCWPLKPSRRTQQIAAIKARAAAKPVAAVIKKPIVDLPEPELRTWTDDTGRFTTSARFAGMVNQNVTLRKLDDSQVNLPLERLSMADQEWIESRRSAR